MHGSIVELPDFDRGVFNAEVEPALSSMLERDKLLRRGECLVWMGGTTENGYPESPEGKSVHRGLVKHLGVKVPRNRVVRHLCGERLCIRPSHLGLGTNGENMTDRDKHGATAKGESNGNSKLSDVQRGEIRDRHYSGESYRDIADSYPVSHVQVYRICRAVKG